jgi:plastocyanin
MDALPSVMPHASAPAVSVSPSASLTPRATPVGTVSAPTAHQVDIEGFAFAPASLTVNKGDTVVFTNQDSAAHTVTAASGAFTSGPLAEDAAWTLNTADLAPGTYSYHCNFHPSMQGSITVR